MALPLVVFPPRAVNVAVITVVPAARLVALPPPATTATLVLLLVQVTALLRLGKALPLKLPVAVNCVLKPASIDGVPGVTAIDVNGTLMTVKVDVSLWPLTFEVIVVVPVARVLAKPALVIVATVVLELVQLPAAVTFIFEPSDLVAIDRNWRFDPTVTVGLTGTTVIDVVVAAVTVKVAVPLTPAWVALIVTVPAL